MRFLVSPDGYCSEWWYVIGELPPRLAGWHDCTEMNKQEFDEFVTSLQKKGGE